MGGLVIKKVDLTQRSLIYNSYYIEALSLLTVWKAFILAQDEPHLRDRIRTIFFLGTPHRGSNYAAVLNNILSVSGVMSPRHFISDLTKGSISVQMINDDFGKYAHELPIFSFYETTKTSVGISPVYVVDKESAVLGM